MNLESGPRLDALVAKHILNLHPICKYLSGHDLIETDIPDVDAKYYHGTFELDTALGKVDMPRFSESISAAWEVVEKLKEIKVNGWDVDDKEEIFPINIIWRNHDKEWEVVWSPAYWKNEHFTSAPTISHAICLAALKAEVKE